MSFFIILDGKNGISALQRSDAGVGSLPAVRLLSEPWQQFSLNLSMLDPLPERDVFTHGPKKPISTVAVVPWAAHNLTSVPEAGFTRRSQVRFTTPSLLSYEKRYVPSS